jgi:HAD superfamily hydrolase (TIGR01484 family)
MGGDKALPNRCGRKRICSVYCIGSDSVCFALIKIMLAFTFNTPVFMQPSLIQSMVATNLQLMPITQLNASKIVGILVDVDDTLTTDGKLLPQVYEALWALRSAGFKLIPVTGRSTGWAHMMMTQWPVDAVVAESGGTWLTRNASGAIKLNLYAPNLTQERDALLSLSKRLIEQNPPLSFALDNDYRCVDVAIDYNEQTQLTPAQQPIVSKVMQHLIDAGFKARASSIHINTWAGDFDKAPATTRLINEHFPQHADPQQWVFVGDAPNDQSMFSAFSNSVGVANILPHMQSGQMQHLPRFVTTGEYGLGFCEVAAHLLQSKKT